MRRCVNKADGFFYLDICESSSSFLLSLVNDTLDFASMQAGKFKMNFETFKVSDILAEVYQLINVQLHIKTKVFLIQSISDEAPEEIESDYSRLK